MKTAKFLLNLLAFGIAAGLAVPAARADQSPAAAAQAPTGTIVGLVTNSDNVLVARATVTAARVDGGVIRATVSGSDGVYSIADPEPGAWSLTVGAAGYP